MSFGTRAKVVIVGGHGQVALRLARLLAPSYSVTSIIRDPAHSVDVTQALANPIVLSLEDSPVEDFTNVFSGAKAVVFSAGAGGKGGPERTKQVDYDGALKAFDAIEKMDGTKPRLIHVSAVDVRNPDKYPSHYVRTALPMSTCFNSCFVLGRC